MINTNRAKRRLAAVLLAAVTILGAVNVSPVEVSAKNKGKDHWPKKVSIDSPCAIAMEINTGTILYEKNANEKHYPASITKILTTLLAIENSNMDDEVVFSEDAVFKNEGDTSHIFRDVGEKMTMEQTLYAVMLESANECAYQAAEYVGQSKGGDYRTFIDMMNEKAKELGCKNTHFNNSNGLPDKELYTSAYDMALISSAAYKNEEFRTITGTKTYTIPPTNKHKDPTYLSNHHCVLHYHDTGKYINPYCTGGKTGFTKVANSTLVTFAEKDGMSIVVVIMNANSPSHYIDTNKLINFCFNNFKVYNIAENEKSIQVSSTKNVGILNTSKPFVTLDESAYIILPNSVDFSEASFERDEDPEAGTVVSLKYTYSGREVGSVAIVTSGAKVTIDYFDKQQYKDDGIKVVRVKPIYAVGGVILFILLIVAIIYLKKFYDDFYIIKHKRKVNRQQRERFRAVRERRRRPRKKDRMFK